MKKAEWARIKESSFESQIQPKYEKIHMHCWCQGHQSLNENGGMIMIIKEGTFVSALVSDRSQKLREISEL